MGKIGDRIDAVRKANFRLGNAPIEQQYAAFMNDLAKTLDQTFNGDKKGDDRDTGFILLQFPLHGHKGRCNYISNAERSDVIVLLKEQLAYFEGQAEKVGSG
jgi:hypothetical protein